MGTDILFLNYKSVSVNLSLFSGPRLSTLVGTPRSWDC